MTRRTKRDWVAAAALAVLILAAPVALAVPGNSILVGDDDGNLYVLEVPQIKYTNATRFGGGINTDVLAELSFMSYRDPSETITVRMVRWDA